ncbi:MAG: hypothetical protein Q4D91_08880 [Lautropia sp.]|nr:hypothetical protein [Lautropia sp.]
MRQTPIVPLGEALVATLLASCGGGSGKASTQLSSSPSTAGTTTTPATGQAPQLARLMLLKGTAENQVRFC